MKAAKDAAQVSLQRSKLTGKLVYVRSRGSVSYEYLQISERLQNRAATSSEVSLLEPEEYA